jgi:hypothetical protein
MHFHMPMASDECAWCFVLGMALATLSMVILCAAFSLLSPRPRASTIVAGAERLRAKLEAQARAKLKRERASTMVSPLRALGARQLPPSKAPKPRSLYH